MDEIRVRELPQKDSNLSLSDLMIVEDEDGTKIANIGAFKSLVQQATYYETVEDMKNAVLNEGDYIRTLGYREPNDGGGAFYQIVYAPTDIEDGIYIHYLHTSDTLRAHYIRSDGDINISQAGAYGDGVNDDFEVIQKMLDSGSMVTVPRRTYKISGSLDIPSNITIDLNGATILCNNSAALSIGLTHEAKNITIKNGKFVGVNGIELYTLASEVTISDCEFYSSSKATMSKGIILSGASNIRIHNCKIGSVVDEVKYGIYITNGGGEENDECINYNIQMSQLSIFASTAGVSFSGTYVDKNISLSDFIIEGYGDRQGKEIYGILVSCNSDSISITNGKFRNCNTGLMVTGIITAVMSCSDVMMEDCDIMYNFSSAGSTIYLNGVQRFTGNRTGTAYIFDRLTSKIILQGEFDADRDTTNIKGIYKTSLIGDLYDTVSPIGRNMISVTSLSQLNDTSNKNKIPGYKNVSLNLEFTGQVSTIQFPSLNGQVIALYSDIDGCVLKSSQTLKIPNEITLTRYEPVLLKNKSGVWTMVQFGGSGDSSGGSSGGGTSSGPTIMQPTETLSVYFGNTKACDYNGSVARSLTITPEAIEAAPRKHSHTTGDIIGMPVIPDSMKNPNRLVIQVNNGITEGVDMITYDGSEEKLLNINLPENTGGGEVQDLSAYALKLNFEGTGHFSVNRSEYTTKGGYSIAMGENPEATADNSISIGLETSASGVGSIAMGEYSMATADCATAIGYSNIANGRYSSALGKESNSVGEASFTIGTGTVTTGNNQFAFGRYNTQDPEGTYVLMIGAGSGDENRKNIVTIDWSGNAKFNGTITAAEPIEDSHLTTKHYTDTLINNTNTSITEINEAIEFIKEDTKYHRRASHMIDDWDQVNSNGFVMGINAQNSPPSVQTGWLMGISIVKHRTTLVNGVAVPDLNSIPTDAILILFDPSDQFEYIGSSILEPAYEEYADDGNDEPDEGEENPTEPTPGETEEPSTFENTYVYGLPAYIRKKVDRVWGDWYKVYLGRGKVDEAAIIE